MTFGIKTKTKYGECGSVDCLISLIIIIFKFFWLIVYLLLIHMVSSVDHA